MFIEDDDTEFLNSEDDDYQDDVFDVEDNYDENEQKQKI